MSGNCPKCGSEYLEYSAVIMEDEHAVYPFKCEDCGCEGKEWYLLQYIETTTSERKV